MKRNIGIIGAGNVGQALAKQMVKIGNQVKIANSRGASSLGNIEAQTGAKATDIGQITYETDILILAVPLGSVEHLSSTINFSNLMAVIDAGNYYPDRDGVIPDIDQGLTESEWVSKMIGSPVIKAFNNIMAVRLYHAGEALSGDQRIALPVSGDDINAKNLTRELIEGIGFIAFDAGSLAESWRQQPGTPAYCTDPTIKELPVLLKKADRQKAVNNRQRAAKMASKIPADFPVEDLVRVSRLSAGLDIFKFNNWRSLIKLLVAALKK